MARTSYSVERLQGKWVVLVSGAKVLTCQKKSFALKAVRRAMALLIQQQQSPLLCQQSDRLRIGKGGLFQVG
jgi:hypothetical protein